MILKTFQKAFLLTTTACLLITPLAHAEYQVDPLRVEVAIPESQNVKSTAVTVRNIGKETIRLKAYLSNWTMDEKGNLQLIDKPTPNGISENVRFNPKEFEIAPNQAQVVRLAIALPEGSTSGEYRSILFFEDLKTQTKRMELGKTGYGAALEIKQRLGVAIYVYKGTITSQPLLSQFDCKLENGKLTAALQLENTGTKHYRGNGTFLISQIDPTTGTNKPFKEIP